MERSIVSAVSSAYRSRYQFLDSFHAHFFIDGYFDFDIHEVTGDVTTFKFNAQSNVKVLEKLGIQIRSITLLGMLRIFQKLGSW